jgi:preprotein translocase subunit SecE
MKKPRPRAIKQRAAKTAAVTAPASALAAEATAAPEARKKPPFNPARFFREVRAEAGKITWPSRKETVITSVMVFIMVIITAVFFAVVDVVLHFAIDFLLRLANSGSLS